MKENEFKLTHVRFYFENCESVIVPIENFSQLILNNVDILQSNYETLKTIHKVITTGNITFEDNHNLIYRGCDSDNANPLDRFTKYNDLTSIDLCSIGTTMKDTTYMELEVKWYYEDEEDEYERQYENKNIIITSSNYYSINIGIKPYTQTYSLSYLSDNKNKYIGNEFEDTITKDRYIFSDVNKLKLPTLMPISSRCKYNFTSGVYKRVNCGSLFDLQYGLMKVKKSDFMSFINYINTINMGMSELKLNDETKAQPYTIYFTVDNNSEYIIIGAYDETKRWLHDIYELDIEDLDEWYI